MKKKLAFSLLSFLLLGVAGCANQKEENSDSFDIFAPFEFRFVDNYFSDRTLLSDSTMYQMDYRKFVDNDPKNFDIDLAKLSLALSCELYSWNSYEFATYGKFSEGTFIEKIKATDVTMFSVDETKYVEDLNDLCTFEIAHYDFDYNNAHQQVFFVIYKGTDKDVEWASNMDVGANTTEYLGSDDHADWKNRKNHKGLDVAANRSFKDIDSYISEHKDGNSNIILLISGHSRGAGVANLAGAHYANINEYKTFCYTFGGPGTTTEENKDLPIYNFYNAEDILASLPFTEIGFYKYGNTYYGDVLDYTASYSEFTNHTYASLDIEELKTEILKYVSCRDDLYKMPSEYKDEKACDSGFILKAEANAARSLFIDYIESNNLSGKVEVSDVFYDEELKYGYRWKCIPSLVLDAFAGYMASKRIAPMTTLPKIAPSVTELLLVNASGMISGIEPIAYPHMPEAYWTILKNHGKK